MGRGFTKKEMEEIEAELLHAGVPVSEIAEYERKARKFKGEKKESTSEVDPSTLPEIAQQQRRNELRLR
jgi:hypothetical protein